MCQKLSLGGWEKPVGALIFGVGLVAVLILEANLYTGKIGYIDAAKSWFDVFDITLMLLLNLTAAFVVGLVFRGCMGDAAAMASRLAKPWYRILLDSIGCGACIYIAVEGYKQTKSFVPVILGVMAFILAGFEHCVADAFYYGTSELTWKGLGYIGLIVLGNSIGSLLIRFLQKGIKHEEH